MFLISKRKKSIHFLIIPILIVIFQISPAPSTPHQLHPIPIPIVHEVGDVCNEVETCVEGTFCDPDGLCSCPNPAKQVFDTYRKKCVAQVFETCHSSEDCTQFASCILQWNATLARFHGTCQCTGKYFKLPFEPICGPRSRFGEPCNEHLNDINYQPCDSSQNLRCRGGQRNGIPYGNCLCENNSTYVYDEQRRACAIRAGHHCFSQRSNAANICVYSAKCLHFQKRIGDKTHSASSGRKGALSSKTGRSTKEFASHSWLPTSSSSGLTSTATVSGSGLGSSGTSNSSSNANPGSLRCRCEAGFWKTPEGFCRPTLGGRCDQRNPCIEHAGLICSNGECQCESPLYQIFDERLNKCLCKVGSTCHGKIGGLIQGQGHRYIHSQSQNHGHGHGHGHGRHSCVRHAHCHANIDENYGDSKFSNSNSTSTLAPETVSASSFAHVPSPAPLLEFQGTCRCNPGFSKSADGQCKLDYGMNCTSIVGSSNHGDLVAWAHVDCNNDAGLACQNGNCVCFDSRLEFDKKERICVNRFEEFCGIYKDEMSGVQYRVGCNSNM